MLGFILPQEDEIRGNDKPINLSDLRVNEPARILSVDGGDNLNDRLDSVGISPGGDVRLLRRGAAVVVHGEGGRFCLREEAARRITVRPLVA